MRVINKLFEIPEELSGGISKVTVIGFNRMLIEMTKDDLIVTGTIESVEFEKIDKK